MPEGGRCIKYPFGQGGSLVKRFLLLTLVSVSVVVWYRWSLVWLEIGVMAFINERYFYDKRSNLNQKSEKSGQTQWKSLKIEERGESCVWESEMTKMRKNT